MKLRCIHCGFESTEPENKSEGLDDGRCPSCMRRDAMRPVGHDKSVNPSKKAKSPSSLASKRWHVFGGAGVGLTLLALCFWWFRSPGLPDEVSEKLAALDIPSSRLESGDTLGALAEKIDSTNTQGGGAALLHWTQKQLTEGKIVLWEDEALRRQPFGGPEEIAKRLRRPDGQSLYSLELAMLLQALAEEKGLTAAVVEVFRRVKEERPADPSARFGAYALAIRKGDKWVHYDPLSTQDSSQGGGSSATGGKKRRLNQTQIVARMLAHDALYEAYQEEGGRSSNRLIRAAIELDGSSAAVRTLAAVVAAESGRTREAIEETEAAASLRDDSVRRFRLAQAYAAQGEVSRAKQLLSRTLGSTPGFLKARLAHMEILLSEDKLDEIRRELAVLQRGSLRDQAKNSAEALLLRAQYYARRDEPGSC